MTYSYTPDQPIPHLAAVIGIAISMAGRRGTRPATSAAPSNKPWALIFAGKILRAVLFDEWFACQNQGLHYSNGDSWDRMLRQGIMLLTRFCQDDRIQVPRASTESTGKFTGRSLHKNDFVAYIDAIGQLDGTRCLLEWKTSSGRYPEEPDGLLSLDPQLVCYSWITGIAEVAQVVFVRKRLVEVQYLPTTITDAQRQEFGHLVEDTILRIESQFLPHSGIRFPQYPAAAVRTWGLSWKTGNALTPGWCDVLGAESLDWLDELDY